MCSYSADQSSRGSGGIGHRALSICRIQLVEGFFLRHYRLEFCTKNRARQTSPVDDNALSRAFATKVREWIQKLGYSADKTDVFVETIPKKKINARGKQTMWVKCGRQKKQRATATLLADSDGNNFSSFILLKSKPPTSEEPSSLHFDSSRFRSRAMYRDQEAPGRKRRAILWQLDCVVEHRDDYRVNAVHLWRPHDHKRVILLLLDLLSGHWKDEVQAYAVREDSAQIQATCKVDVESYAQLASHNRGSDAFLMFPPDRGDIAHWISQSWLASLHVPLSLFCVLWLFVQFYSVVEEEPDVDDTTNLVTQLQTCVLFDSQVGYVSVVADVVDFTIKMSNSTLTHLLLNKVNTPAL
uniref:AlNc14C118G6588 protein n=1 Tax=Albugo laibachii Nc14 TaxID=890382 RepID=F0WJ57_9STRA|nr:AlNc14C118G6588 [Albugo laibachii Nc14]|eukprot:CCA21303.1 AlNc14C118G6588 [Albugo laibachii Nc14]